jgi:chemotaxis protein CheX
MLGMGDDEVGDADVSDTIGEIANVVGGNVKAILAPNAVLSLPVVALKTTRPHVKDAVERDQVAFRWEGLHGWIAIWAPPA